MRDKRIRSSERAPNGACPTCERRHIHTDDCAVLKRREDLRPRTLIRTHVDPWQHRDRRIESGL